MEVRFTVSPKMIIFVVDVQKIKSPKRKNPGKPNLSKSKDCYFKQD